MRDSLSLEECVAVEKGKLAVMSMTDQKEETQGVRAGLLPQPSIFFLSDLMLSQELSCHQTKPHIVVQISFLHSQPFVQLLTG